MYFSRLRTYHEYTDMFMDDTLIVVYKEVKGGKYVSQFYFLV